MSDLHPKVDMRVIEPVVRRELHQAFEWGRLKGTSGILATEDQIVNEGEFQIMAVVQREVRNAGGIQQDGCVESEEGLQAGYGYLSVVQEGV